MAFLLAGLALGATAVALSERDRGYYQQARYTMDYLGNKNGLDIYKDRVSGFYYTDDGFDIRRVGKQGWHPHPVDEERLAGLLSKHSPGQLKFVGYILATYAGSENKLWEATFQRFQLPKEPPKPHFSKKLRKKRWERYDEEYAAWQKAARSAKAKFVEESAAWAEKRARYDGRHEHATSGTNLLHRALDATPAAKVETFKLVVPSDKRPGDLLTVQAGGQQIEVIIPPGAQPGSAIQFELPKGAAATTAVPQAQPVPRAEPSQQPPPQQQQQQRPPSAMGAAPKRRPPAPTATATGGNNNNNNNNNNNGDYVGNPFDSGYGGGYDGGAASAPSATAPPPALGAPSVPASAPPPPAIAPKTSFRL